MEGAVGPFVCVPADQPAARDDGSLGEGDRLADLLYLVPTG